MINTPINVLCILPTPPVKAVPPIITAAIAGNKNSLASVGDPADILDERTIPEIAASEADKISAKY